MRTRERSTANGRMTYAFPSPGIMVNTMTGHYAADLLSFCLAGMADGIEGGPLVMFFDWEGMTGYDVDCRREMTKWTMDRKAQIGKVHILVKSKLVAMGVSVANLLLGGDTICSYTDRPKFEGALRAACRR